MLRLALQYDCRHNSWTARHDGVLYVLANTAAHLATDSEQEYMIVNRLGKHPNGYLIEPVTNEYTLIQHTGFECSGSMCRTVAFPIKTDRPSYLTPGRVEPLLNVADNVNVNWSKPIYDAAELQRLRARSDWNESLWQANEAYDATQKGCIGWYKVPPVKPVPGAVYIRNGERRAAGIPGPMLAQ